VGALTAEIDAGKWRVVKGYFFEPIFPNNKPLRGWCFLSCFPR
jgi:hypothetical protein